MKKKGHFLRKIGKPSLEKKNILSIFKADIFFIVILLFFYFFCMLACFNRFI